MSHIQFNAFVWHPEMGDCAPTSLEAAQLRRNLQRGIAMPPSEPERPCVHMWITADTDEALVVAELPHMDEEIKIYPKDRILYVLTIRNGQATVERGLELPFKIDTDAIHAWSNGPLLYIHAKAKTT